MKDKIDYPGLLRLAAGIGRETDLDGLLTKILTDSLPWMRVEACSIFLLDEATGDLVMHSGHGAGAPKLAAFRVPSGQGVAGTAMAERRIVRVDDATADARVYKEADRASGWTTRALLAAPLLDGEECLGVVEFLNPVGRPAFTVSDEQLVDYFAGLVAAALVRVRAQAAAVERAALQRDLELARELQSGLLPRTFPSADKPPGLEMFARLDAAREVSGDFYDFFFIEPGRLCFLVADVSGKGVAAGLFMAMTRTLVRALARPGMTPVEILSAVNAELCRNNEPCLFVTMLLGMAGDAGEISCALGGHNPPVRLTAGRDPVFGPLGGAPLGLMEDAVFAPWSLTLDSGDALVFYTDGVTEALDEAGELFSNERLLRELSGPGMDSAEAIARRVASAVERHAAAAERSDDTTILVLRRPAV